MGNMTGFFARYSLKKPQWIAGLIIFAILILVHQEFTYSESAAQLASGDLLLLYTDGVTEALNASKELFGEARLLEYLQANRQLAADQLLTGLLQEVNRFTGRNELDDDLTVIALKKL